MLTVLPVLALQHLRKSILSEKNYVTWRELMQLLPRLIRFRDAPTYLGMDRNRFNSEVRPHITAIPIGIQGIAFDRLDLDAWVEQYKHCSGRPAVTNSRSMELWDAKCRQDSSKEVSSG